MNKITVILALLCGALLFGAAKAEAAAVVSSTANWQLIEGSSNTTGDLLDVTLSTGYNNGTFFVCVDSRATVTFGATGQALFFSSFTVSSQFLFPPIPFIPSTAAVAGAGYNMTFSLSDGNRGGTTWNNALICIIDGADRTFDDSSSALTNLYRWTVRTVETPRTSER